MAYAYVKEVDEHTYSKSIVSGVKRCVKTKQKTTILSFAMHNGNDYYINT
jgi:hypothetical protein